jgi:hypothetical protein
MLHVPWLTYFCQNVLNSLRFGVKSKHLPLPVLLVVREALDELDVELVTMLTSLTACVFNPSEHENVVNEVLHHVELDYSPSLCLPCTAWNPSVHHVLYTFFASKVPRTPDLLGNTCLHAN